jgi:hypothetical protein
MTAIAADLHLKFKLIYVSAAVRAVDFYRMAWFKFAIFH